MAPRTHEDTPEQSDPRRQPAGRGPRLLRHRRHRHHRRRPLAGLHHRHHRLPPVHAAHQGSGNRRNAAGEVERVGSVVWAATIARSSTPSRTRSRSASSSSWRHTRARRTRAGRAGLSGRRRALQPRRRPHPRRQVPGAGIGQPHHQRIAVAAGRRARRRVHPHQPARGRARVLHRPPQRPVVHPHQRRGRNFRLVTAPVATPGREHWTERFPIATT
jgi:hypothetical protein